MFSKDILKRAEKREQRSRDHEKRYENGEESALREFCRLDPFAIKTPWVQKAIETCLLSGTMGPLTNLFTTGKREKKSRITAMAENLLINVAVDQKSEETGLPKNNPLNKYGYKSVYNTVYDDQALTFGKAQDMEPKTLLNHCSLVNKQLPDIMIEHTKRGVILRCGPTMEKVNNEPLIGVFEIFYPADSGKPEISGTGVYNIPLGKDPTEKLKKSFITS